MKKEILITPLSFLALNEVAGIAMEKEEIMKLCPYRYEAYDITNKDCPVCGQGKLYQADRLCKGKLACAGWVHPVYGPLSCESYAGLSKTN